MGKPNHKKYVYVGPVEIFGKCVAHKWMSTTYAPSMQKALNNFKFQVNQLHGKIPTSKVGLPGKIFLADRKESA